MIAAGELMGAHGGRAGQAEQAACTGAASLRDVTTLRSALMGSTANTVMQIALHFESRVETIYANGVRPWSGPPSQPLGHVDRDKYNKNNTKFYVLEF